MFCASTHPRKMRICVFARNVGDSNEGSPTAFTPKPYATLAKATANSAMWHVTLSPLGAAWPSRSMMVRHIIRTESVGPSGCYSLPAVFK
jgi:hypothetical protein